MLFSYVVKFLREAALDPQVRSIKITIYRLAQISHIASSLINAAKNGKKVTVVIELRARFDEQANIDYAEQMQDEGVNLLFGVAGLKVHSKICVIEREETNVLKKYGFISTGNFNESTAKVYTDFTLFTSDQKILKDVNKVFSFFDINYKIYRYKHIITSPHYTKSKLFALVDTEIENVKNAALKTPLQAIVASLEGMKIRVDREVLLHQTTYPKMLILGEKDPVLNYQETKKQIINTNVELVTFPDGHMSYIENQEALTTVLLDFFKKI